MHFVLRKEGNGRASTKRISIMNSKPTIGPSWHSNDDERDILKWLHDKSMYERHECWWRRRYFHPAFHSHPHTMFVWDSRWWYVCNVFRPYIWFFLNLWGPFRCKKIISLVFVRNKNVSSTFSLSHILFMASFIPLGHWAFVCSVWRLSHLADIKQWRRAYSLPPQRLNKVPERINITYPWRWTMIGNESVNLIENMRWKLSFFMGYIVLGNYCIWLAVVLSLVYVAIVPLLGSST